MISDEGSVAIIGSVSFGENTFGTGGRKDMGSIEVAAGTPKSIRSVGEGVTSGGDIAQVKALSRSDVSASYVECLQRSLQFGGSDPFLTASRVVKLSSNMRWN